jgi:hypothetical protein
MTIKKLNEHEKRDYNWNSTQNTKNVNKTSNSH